MARWVVENLGPDVPMHFTAFHPDWKMLDVAPTPPATLMRARQIALEAGVRYAYTGNIDNPEGGGTFCHRCGALLVGRHGYTLTHWALENGACGNCGEPCAGLFERAARAVGTAAPSGPAQGLRVAAIGGDPWNLCRFTFSTRRGPRRSRPGCANGSST